MKLRPLWILPLLVFGTANARPPEQPSYHSLTREFADFARQTRSLPATQRVTLFRERFDALFPGYYEPGADETVDHYNANVTRALDGFPAIRVRFEQVEKAFPSAFATAMTHFRQYFPDFRPTLPIWFIHSLGGLDGGVRTVRGQDVMIFGADVIARIHSDDTLGPFLDHELFHLENGRWFKDCEPDTPVWCALWREGAATYAASVMNPGATDQMLMLVLPEPIRAPVEANWRVAVCAISQDLEKSDQATYARYFLGRGESGPLPHRAGYYLGYRLLQRVGSHSSLAQIDRFDTATVHRVVKQELEAMVKEAGATCK
ncbi:MAG: hypothetical protein JSR66_09415 [Proteobacteria bacterium]|nr:hypothetical protein [Pseudomonadota bacterium]